MAKTISCTDTAKLIRKALKEAFFDIKFSVKSHQYSGGASIGVRWIDGPNVAQVEAVVKRFAGSSFDGMQDLKCSRFHMIDGIEVSFGADYVNCYREYSDAAIEKAIARVFRQFAGNFSGAKMTPPQVSEYRSGSLMSVEVPGLGTGYGRDLQHFVRDALAKNADRLAIANSPTAGKVFQTRTDGHGQSDFDAVQSAL